MDRIDVAIVGGGPAGLCLARTLVCKGLGVTVFEAGDREGLADPAEDGREIALTHASRDMLERIGVWQHLPTDQISPLRDAAVFDGESDRPMRISHRDGGRDCLGWLVANQQIRRAAFAAVDKQPGVSLETGSPVDCTRPGIGCRRIKLADGRLIEARLVIAADSRFSNLRRMAGIGARMRDFGRSMLVARVEIERDHQHVAWEWFGYDRTMALLPLNGQLASVVITLPHAQAQRLAQLKEAEFSAELTELYRGRLGEMTLCSERHIYPLIGVWPDRLVTERLALVGDAAVGMHPVTAHGFNLGLTGIGLLARELARSGPEDIGDPARLAAYQQRHRQASLPLYLATAAVVGLYTDTRLPARILRRSALRLAHRLPPFRRAVARRLTDDTGRPNPLKRLRALVT